MHLTLRVVVKGTLRVMVHVKMDKIIKVAFFSKNMWNDKEKLTEEMHLYLDFFEFKFFLRDIIDNK